MIIYKKEKFQEVSPSEGMLLFLDGQVFEGLCCPLNVNAATLYTEITLEEAAVLTINQEENTEGEADGDNSITNT